MTQLFANAARTTLASGITDTATSLTVALGDAFPVANTGAAAIGPGADWFKAVLDNGTAIEIVYVRTHTSGSETFGDVLRGQEGTTAVAWSAGAVVGVRWTAGDAVDAVNKPLVLVDASTSRTLTAQDSGAYIRFTGAGSKTALIESAAGFVPGTKIKIANRAASGDLAIEGAGVQINPPKGGIAVLQPGQTVSAEFVTPTLVDLDGAVMPVSLRYVGGKAVSRTAIDAWSTSLTDLTGGIGSAPQEGDVVVVAISTASDASTTANESTAGYTQLVNQGTGDGQRSARLKVIYKRMGATPDTSIAFSGFFTSSHSSSVAIHVWRGVSPSTPIDVTSTTATGSTETPDPPAITPATPGAVVLAMATITKISAPSSLLVSNGMSNFVTAGTNANFYDGAVGMASAAWTSGAYDPPPFTYSGANLQAAVWVAATVALRLAE